MANLEQLEKTGSGNGDSENRKKKKRMGYTLKSWFGLYTVGSLIWVWKKNWETKLGR